jgi:1,3-beta-glucanosyltransferase GAS5
VNYDPLADVKNCKLNIPYMKELGLNSIRVYTTDNSADHSECMKLLADAGIYLILDGDIVVFKKAPLTSI